MMEALIAYRRIKARETLVDARILAKDGSPSSALNRIYYAMFYEVLALLLTKELSAAKHTGVRALFNEHFVKPGLVSVDLGRLFSRMFEFRQKCDYGDFVKITKENIAEWLEQAVVFVDEIDKVVEGSMRE